MAEALTAKVVVDTDVLLEHVLGSADGDRSTLRRLTSDVFCYTTVFNVIEAFALCATVLEQKAVEETLQSLKILGLNAKSGKMFGRLYGRHSSRNTLHLLTAGVCLESRLPLVTGRARMYAGIQGLEIVAAERMMTSTTSRQRSSRRRG